MSRDLEKQVKIEGSIRSFSKNGESTLLNKSVFYDNLNIDEDDFFALDVYRIVKAWVLLTSIYDIYVNGYILNVDINMWDSQIDTLLT